MVSLQCENGVATSRVKDKTHLSIKKKDRSDFLLFFCFVERFICFSLRANVRIWSSQPLFCSINI